MEMRLSWGGVTRCQDTRRQKHPRAVASTRRKPVLSRGMGQAGLAAPRHRAQALSVPALRDPLREAFFYAVITPPHPAAGTGPGRGRGVPGVSQASVLTPGARPSCGPDRMPGEAGK